MSRYTIDFGTYTLEQARVRLGLTNRDVWEGLGVGETTWMRWKRNGRVPIERLTDVVLFLDLDEPPDLPAGTPKLGWVLRENAHQAERLGQELHRLGAVVDRLTELERVVGDLQRRLDPPSGAPGRRD